MSTEGVLGNMVEALSRLPGVGRRSAERMALRLAGDPGGLLTKLVKALDEGRKSLKRCSKCGNVTTVKEDPCRLCTDVARDCEVICVVEDPADIRTIEKSGAYRGRYHALMGKVSPMRDISPDDLRIKALLERVEKEDFREVILALSTDVESDATAAYIAEALKPYSVKVSRPAFGLPVGSGIGFSDAETLSRAFRGRVQGGGG
ncbi:MAG: recombination mediator RecR [Kiritimatiellia bacterium]